MAAPRAVVRYDDAEELVASEQRYHVITGREHQLGWRGDKASGTREVVVSTDKVAGR